MNEDKKKVRSWLQVCGIKRVPLDGTKYGLIHSIAYEEQKGKPQNAEAVKESERAVGVTVDDASESAAPGRKFSRRSFLESDYVQDRENAAKDLATRLGISVKKAEVTSMPLTPWRRSSQTTESAWTMNPVRAARLSSGTRNTVGASTIRYVQIPS